MDDVTNPSGHGVVSMINLGAVCGALAGVGGFVHGVGEIEQGGPSPGPAFNSWATGRIAENLGGEPAMSLVSDLRLTGALTVVVSVAVVVWSVVFLERRRSGRVLAVLVLAMLLVGGGFGPPALGLLGALAVGGARADLATWAPRLDGPFGRRLATWWTTLFWVCVANATLLVLGSFVAAVVLDVAVPDVFVLSLFVAVVTMPIATLSGIADRLCTATSGLGREPLREAGRLEHRYADGKQ